MTASKQPLGFSTRAIHSGQKPDPHTGALIGGIEVSTPYMQDGIGNLREGYDYGRASNPTRRALEEQLAALENGSYCYTFASGLAAEDACIRRALQPGDHIVVGSDLYGGSFRLLERILAAWGLTHTHTALSDPAWVHPHMRPNTKLVWVETPSNPLLAVTDIAQLAQVAHEHDALLLVDNTFVSPYLQNPLSLGADIVIHSLTKYIGGHSDLIGGAVVLRDAHLARALSFHQFAGGAILSPFDAFLATRGLKTLAVRMERHCHSARVLAHWLDEQDEVAQVYYPGMPPHPGHEAATRQMRDYGGMIAIQLAGGEQAARAFAEGTAIFALAESLGAVESLISYPKQMTHSSTEGTDLAVPADVVRLSVGLEDVEDLRADLGRALRPR